MTQFKAMAPDVQVSGAAVLSVVEALGAFRRIALQILSDHGINDPQASAWYSQQAWLDAFKEIAERIGPATLLAIGGKIPEMALWPPEIDSVEKALASIDVAYHMNHRGGEIGHYHFEKLGEGKGRIVCPNPYPCEFDFGLIEATAQRFAPQGTVIIVRHDDTQPCRRKEGPSCTYLVTW